jgi:hypothetical protein
MPSPLVNRYAVYVSLSDRGKVREPIARNPSLILAIESCFSAYQETGHTAYVIEDRRPSRVFALDRKLMLAFLYVKTNDRTRYFEILNRLDRSGEQRDMEAMLAHVSLG